MESDRDFPVPMDELRGASAERLIAPIRARADAIEAEIRDELAALGLALVDRARFERLLKLAGALEEHWPSVRFFAERYISHDETPHVRAIGDALVALEAGDLVDDLP